MKLACSRESCKAFSNCLIKMSLRLWAMAHKKNKLVTRAKAAAKVRPFSPDFILFLREKRWPSGRRGIATRVALRASHDPHFSMFAWFLLYCMDVQFSNYRSGPAPAGEGQACQVA